MLRRKSASRVRRCIVVGVEALVARADVDVDVTSVFAVDVVVAIDCAAGSGGSTVITISTAQIKKESRTCTAEWTTGTVTSGCGIVLGTAVANTAACVIVGRVDDFTVVLVVDVVVAVECCRDENPSACFPFTNRRFGRRLGSLFAWRRIERRRSETTKSNRLFFCRQIGTRC